MNDPDSSSDPLIDVFNQAKLQPSAEERRRFLEAACNGDASLCAKVDELLRAHDDAGSFLNANVGVSPDLEAEFARLKPEEAGDRIGNYKLLQQIGEGGFGTVWMAEQNAPVKRRVALKIIKLGMDTKEVVARFEQERQALAMMDHPNIARVFDAGATPVGRPFFVMELVRGIKITEYCDEQELSTEERVELFIHVCQAVQHAHQKGIIHRDLKPSNILVTINDGQAVPKVIDFGVAKATQGHLSDATLFTQFEQMIGTPLYMSPEQAEMTSLDIDTRSDIYSLGVLLYELLTGKTPIDTSTMARAGMDEIRRIIREVDPPKPSARLKTLDGNELTTTAKRRHTDAGKLPGALQGDIDWIVMKCLEKDRKRRYETANGLAADLQRHLRNEVVIARPPTAAYLLGKLIKRNKLAFTAAAAIAVSIVAGMAATAWQLVQTRKAEQRVVAILDELRATAPTFAEQARALAAKERYDEAIQKLEYAFKLRPDVADYLVAKADLLQAQSKRAKLSAAAEVYREALRLAPGHARAEASAKLCDDLLAAKPAEDGELSRESLARLHLAIQQQQRPVAELVPVARLLGEEKKLLLEQWVARLRELPVSTEHPLEKRLAMRDDGRLALDLSGTKVVDLAPLVGAPVAALSFNGCAELKDIAPLRELKLAALDLSGTGVSDLMPLRDMKSLEKLELGGSRITDLSPLRELRLTSLGFRDCAVTDLSPIRQMPLEGINLRGTRVSDLSPLVGMPIKIIDLTNAPVLDFSPLARLPLEKCFLQQNRITDLSVLRGKPLKELALWGCVEARNYAVLSEIKTLELLLLPSQYRSLPAEDYAAIGALRTHPNLRQIGSEIMSDMGIGATGSKELFWQDWEREQTFVPAIRKSGYTFSLTKDPRGTYVLTINRQSLSDLSFLKGAPLSGLNLLGCKVADLSPIRDLRLTYLWISENPVTDLSPLRGMPLESLSARASQISDLSPLAGLPLKQLYIDACPNVTDVSVLAEIPTLERLTVPMQARNIEKLQKLPNLQMLDFRVTGEAPFNPRSTVKAFWERWPTLTWARALNEAGIKYSATQHEDGRWNVTVTSKDFSDCSVFKGEPIRELVLRGTSVSELRPLERLGLAKLDVRETAVTDISPLRNSTLGASLRGLLLWKCKINDFSPLASCTNLEEIDVSDTDFSDVSVLRSRALQHIRMTNTRVSAISILAGMPITTLVMSGTPVTDVSPLLQCPRLETLVMSDAVQNVEVLRAHPGLNRISYSLNGSGSENNAADFWKEFDTAGWLRKLRAAGYKPNKAERLADGTWEVRLDRTSVTSLEMLRGVRISSLDLGNTAVADLEPLRGMPLRKLWIYNTMVADLSPLAGMPLEYLHVSRTKISSISVLRGMPLKRLRLHGCDQLTDLSPLNASRELVELTIPEQAMDFEFLRDFPKLERIGFWETKQYGGGPPNKTAAEFWAEYDEKKTAGSTVGPAARSAR